MGEISGTRNFSAERSLHHYITALITIVVVYLMSTFPPKLKEGRDHVCFIHHWIPIKGSQYASGTVLATGNSVVNKMDKNPGSLRA